MWVGPNKKGFRNELRTHIFNRGSGLIHPNIAVNDRHGQYELYNQRRAANNTNF